MTDRELIKEEIKRLKTLVNSNESYGCGFNDALLMVDGFIDNLPEEHTNFPHQRNIIDKVFGAGNLESWEYDEAEKLVLLAKEELLKDFADSIQKQPNAKNQHKLVSFDAIMEVVNRRRPYEPSDFIPESFIPDLD